MRTRIAVPVLVLALGLAACTSGGRETPAAAPRPATHDVLVLGTDQGVRSIDAASGSTLFSETSGVATPDWTKSFTSEKSGRSTRLTTRDPATGRVLSTTRVSGDLAIRTVSQDGAQVALAAPLPAGVSVWTPVPRSTTELVVADPRGWLKPARFDLTGNYEPEAFSTDGGTLFMIQYLPPTAPEAYRVTALDLASGEVSPVFGRYKEPTERMPGVRLEQILSPDGSKLYTLYTSQPSAYETKYGGSAASSSPVTFVHILNLKEHWAYCLELPRAFWNEPAQAQAMAASPDGSRLYVVDSTKGLVTEIATERLKVLATEPVQLAPGGSATSAIVSGDGSTLFIGSTGKGAAVHAIDTTSFAQTSTWNVDGTVMDVRMSSDGSELFAAVQPWGGDAARVETYDVRSGRELGELPVTGLTSIEYVGAPVS